LAAVLATIGLTGMMAFSVTRRRQEIGIRVALGAQPSQVIGMVLREAGRLVIVGLAIGGALSLVATRSAAALVFGLKPHDPSTFVFACALLTAVATIASMVPATRASRLDPLTALHEE